MSKIIEIDLLPEELKSGHKAKKAGAGLVALEPKYFLYLIPSIFGILICVHIYLAAITMVKNSQLSVLNNKWQRREPQRNELEGFNKEYATVSEYASALERLMQERVNWAQKLNKLSLDLPSGVWFNEISVSKDNFLLQGSVFSLGKQEMGLIKNFIDNLKNDPVFFSDFNNLELNSVQDKKIGGYDIVDFVLQGALKNK